MTRGVKVRLMIFVLLAAVGIVYVGGKYLGIVDDVLGRGLTLHATLPKSGGLFVGSEVDYRGVKVGKVSKMQVTRDGVRLTLALKQGTKIPVSSPIQVANLTAVGEQYLDFLPTSTKGPYATQGHTFTGTAASLPVSTDTLLVRLSSFVDSLNGTDLRTVVHELGTMFTGNAENLGRLIDSAAEFVTAAKAHEKETISLLDSGGSVLHTQQLHKKDILGFARGLAQISQTLKVSDPQLRTILDVGAPAVREVDALLKGLQPALPPFLGNVIAVNRVLTDRLAALEQVLVTLPKVTSSGFTGTPGDGYGHLNMQFSYTTPACSEGYLPSKDWPPASNTADLPLYNAKCTDKRAQRGYTGKGGINQRGVNFMPPVGASTATANRAAPYDARKASKRDAGAAAPGGWETVFGSDNWEALLIGQAGSVQGPGGR